MLNFLNAVRSNAGLAAFQAWPYLERRSPFVYNRNAHFHEPFSSLSQSKDYFSRL
jgi:hypothetical protein